MGDVFPELKQHEIKIREIIADEEASFGRTLIKVCEIPFSLFHFFNFFVSMLVCVVGGGRKGRGAHIKCLDSL